MPVTPFLSSQGVISFLITNTQNEAILMDPSFDLAQKLVLEIKQKKLKLKYILETHTHADFFLVEVFLKLFTQKLKLGYLSFLKQKIMN